MGTTLTDCEKCDVQGTLVRIPSQVSYKRKNTTNKKDEPGKIVKAYIEDAREDLKIEKKKLRQQGVKK